MGGVRGYLYSFTPKQVVGLNVPRTSELSPNFLKLPEFLGTLISTPFNEFRK
jgi:hypothetical protein